MTDLRTAVRTGAAHRLAVLVEDALGAPLPVRLRAWDGSETGPSDAPVVVLRSRRALRRLLWTLERRWDDVVALVGTETARVWRLYLVGGSLAFEEGRMGVDQILSVRRDRVGAGGLDLSEAADWYRDLV